MRKLWHSKEGSAPILFLGLLFVLLSIMMLVMEYGAAYERYDHAVDIIQRCCNSAVEKNISDKYRADHTLRLNNSMMTQLYFRLYLSEDMPRDYTINIKSIRCISSPPQMTVTGTVSFPTLFSKFGFRRATYSFKVRATNYDLD